MIEIDPILKNYGKFIENSIHRRRSFLVLHYVNLAEKYVSKKRDLLTIFSNYLLYKDFFLQKKNLLLALCYCYFLKHYLKKNAPFVENLKVKVEKFLNQEKNGEKKALKAYKEVLLFRNKEIPSSFPLKNKNTPKSPLSEFKKICISF